MRAYDNDRTWKRSTLLIRGLAGLTTLILGCGEAPSTPTMPDNVDPAAAVDTNALQMALSNQTAAEASGLHLLGRAWFSPLEYAELYGAAELPTTGALTFKGGSRVATNPSLAPQDETSFAAYVDRVKGDITNPLSFAATPGGPTQDVLLFVPSPAAADTGLSVEHSALTNEACPKATFDTFCGSQIGWRGQTTVNSWYTTDNFSADAFSGNGTSINTVICADAGDSTLTLNTNDTTGTFPAAFTQDVAQGFVQWRWWRGGWGQVTHCGSSFLGICLRTDTTVFFTGAGMTVGAHPKTGSGTNYHFCGNIMSAPSYVVTGANGCADKAACPAPVTFDGQGG